MTGFPLINKAIECQSARPCKYNVSLHSLWLLRASSITATYSRYSVVNNYVRRRASTPFKQIRHLVYTPSSPDLRFNELWA